MMSCAGRFAPTTFPTCRPSGARFPLPPGESFLFLSEQNQGDHRLYATEGRGNIAVPIFSVDTHLPAGRDAGFC